MSTIEINTTPSQEQIDHDHATALRSVKVAEWLSKDAVKMVNTGVASAPAREPFLEKISLNPERNKYDDPELTEYVTNYNLKSSGSGIKVKVEPGQRDIVKSESDTLVIDSIGDTSSDGK